MNNYTSLHNILVNKNYYAKLFVKWFMVPPLFFFTGYYFLGNFLNNYVQSLSKDTKIITTKGIIDSNNSSDSTPKTLDSTQMNPKIEITIESKSTKTWKKPKDLYNHNKKIEPKEKAEIKIHEETSDSSSKEDTDTKKEESSYEIEV